MTRELPDYAAVLDRNPDDLRLVQGQYADVVVDSEAGVAWRFPTSEQERQRLMDHARRLTQVAALVLPVPTPRIRSVHATASLGEACIEMSLIPGTPLSDLPPLLPPRRRRLAAGLGDLIRHLRDADTGRMDLDRSGWETHWLDLEARATATLLHHMSPEGRRRACAELRTAADAARAAPLAFIHGDLGGSNVLVDPSRGRVTGIVDWDSARLGDPAVDVAALTTRLDVDLAEEVVRSAGVLPDEMSRADAYRATFALQEAVFGAEQRDDAALSAGLAGYQ